MFMKETLTHHENELGDLYQWNSFLSFCCPMFVLTVLHSEYSLQASELD